MKQTCIDKDDWSFGETDRASAYKNLAIRVTDLGFAYIALRRPTSSRRYAMIPKTLLFGNSADVLRYNTISRLFSAIAARIICIPTIAYFGDFGFQAKSILGNPPNRAVNSATRGYGLYYRIERLRSITQSFIWRYWGDIPHIGMWGKLAIPHSPDRISKIAGIPTDAIVYRSMSHASLERLIGKLNFASTALCSRFSRAMTHPIYRKLAPPRTPSLRPVTLRNLAWRSITWLATPPSVVSTRSDNLDYIIYTDASSDPPEIRRRVGRNRAGLPYIPPIRAVRWWKCSSILSKPIIFALFARYIDDRRIRTHIGLLGDSPLRSRLRGENFIVYR